MYWSELLYRYHRERGGVFLGDRENNGELILTYRDQPLVVDMGWTKGRYSYPYVRARTCVVLERPYQLSVGAANQIYVGVNKALNVLDKGLEVLPNGPDLHTDYGCPEVTRKRMIRTDNRPFTKQVLGSLELRRALLASPGEKLEVCPGPGEEGLHLLSVSSRPSSGGSNGGWYLEDNCMFSTEESEAAEMLEEMKSEFFPRMDGLLELIRTARDAVMAWRM